MQIDAVGLAGRSRRAVLVGEAKWARSEDARRLVRQLERKALALPDASDDLTYVVCARETLVDAPAGTVCVTARDIFG